MIRRAMATWEATNENIYFFEVCIGMSMGMGMGMGMSMGMGMGMDVCIGAWCTSSHGHERVYGECTSSHP